MAGIAVVVVLAACESGAPPGPRAESSPSPSPYLYACYSSLFDPAVFEGGGLEQDDPELRDLVESLDRSYPETVGGWHIVSEEPDRIHALARIPGGYVSRSYRRAFVAATFERVGDRPTPDTLEECRPEVVIGRRIPAMWELAVEPSPGDTRLIVMAVEMACSSGRKLTPDNTQLDVEYTEDAISIVVTGDPIRGGNCVDNPPSRLTVELDEPVGERALFDAAVYPPERRYPCTRRGSRFPGPLVCSQRVPVSSVTASERR